MKRGMNMLSKENKVLIDTGIESKELYIELMGNVPDFTDSEKKKGLKKPFEKYSKLDELNRCRAAFACITGDKLSRRRKKPKHNSRIKPTALKSIKCEGFKGDEYLYHRCHLIGRQLATKKVNRKGLITGTNWFNTEGMFQFEDKVINHIKDNPNHRILYRVTPYFKDNNLLAYGVQMEALDLDEEKFFFNVFVYNKQPRFAIEYSNGDVYSDSPLSLSGKKTDDKLYVIDKDTDRFHIESCASVCNIKNKMYFAGKKQTIEEKYCKCESCIS